MSRPMFRSMADPDRRPNSTGSWRRSRRAPRSRVVAANNRLLQAARSVRAKRELRPELFLSDMIGLTSSHRRLLSDAVAVPDNKHLDHQFWIDRRTGRCRLPQLMVRILFQRRDCRGAG